MTLPSPAHVPSAPARVVALATVRGPSAPASTVLVKATCPTGMAASGGGISTALVGGGTPPSSLHADGMTPLGRPPGVTGSTPDGWAALGATGGQLVLAAATAAVAVCLRATPALRAPTLVVAAVPGPAEAATTRRATATCPPGGLLVGGGAQATVTTGSASPSLHLIGSYPSDVHGSPAGPAKLTSWSAVADAGGRTGSGVETVAFALCATASAARLSVALASRPGPLPSGTATSATASCPATTVLISGGALTGPASGPPQQGLHLTGSFPSDGRGGLVGSAPSIADGNAWTARAESGGQGSPAGTATTAFALCLRP